MAGQPSANRSAGGSGPIRGLRATPALAMLGRASPAAKTLAAIGSGADADRLRADK